VGGGVGDHLLDQRAVSLLDLGDIGQLGARVGEAVRHRVAHLLEPGDVEDARAARCGHAPLDSGAGEGGAEQAGQLGLHTGDLAAQVVAGTALVGLGDLGLERR
jgi:hypothetical protein